MTLWHWIMLLAAGSSLMICRREWLAAASVAWSQVPFWVGSFIAFAGTSPWWYNLFFDLLCAAGFVYAARMFGNWFLIWAGLIFIAATIVDIYALSFGLNFYFELHEGIHYAALIVIVGREYVHRVSSSGISSLRGYLART